MAEKKMGSSAKPELTAVELATQLGMAQRMMEVERRATGAEIKGDFEGNVTGTWMGINRKGAGVVSYRNKNYVTIPVGIVSLPRGARVELSYAKGVYYSKF